MTLRKDTRGAIRLLVLGLVLVLFAVTRFLARNRVGKR